jgi:hypothetical protein
MGGVNPGCGLQRSSTVFVQRVEDPLHVGEMGFFQSW